MDSVPAKRNCSQLPHPALFFRLLLMLIPFLLCPPTIYLASSCRSHPGGPFQKEAFSHLQLPVLPLITLTTLCYKCLFSCPFTPQDYKVLESKMCFLMHTWYLVSYSRKHKAICWSTDQLHMNERK